MQGPFIFQYMQRSADLIDLEVTALMQKEGLKNLTRSHLEILSLLMRHPNITLSDIATKIQRRRPTVTVLIDKLETLGFCSRKINPSDSRSFVVVLTAQGRKKKRAVWRIYLTLHRIGAEILSKAEMEHLHTLSEKVYRALWSRQES